MRPLNSLIIDDEPIAREGIADYCKEISFLNVVALCKNALQANHYLHTYQIDLIFLDINMPLISGIDWLKGIKDSPSIIMTTAYEEYALESFSYNVIDYLVKPISFERFLQSINKVSRYCGNEASKKVIFVKSDKQLKKITMDSILFIEAMQNYIKIVTVYQSITTQMSLKTIKDILPDDFIQTHKSYIVSKYMVDEIIGNQVVIKKHKIPISVRLKKTVLSNLNM
ncbi:LytTR family DNA-binding domain-containing protein [Aquimarina sp. 2201CG1-2-11]|uniref:LytR/AlgR family response regulator transcription factor n=1 Tax=Aquimarina discodermiae TaxID=3231043 RepID=UPI003461B4B5